MRKDKPALSRAWIYILAFCLFHFQTFSQSAKELLEIANSGKFTKTEFLEEIDVEDRFGYLIVDVKIGDQTYDYIFDTGGYNTVTTEIMKRNGIQEMFNVEVGSANKIKSQIGVAKIPMLSLGDLEIEQVGVLNFDFDAAPEINCYTNGGLFGKGIIKEAAWQIDRKAGRIRIADNIEKLGDLGNATELKVRLDKTFNPLLKAKLNGKKVEFLFDLGFGGFISFTQSTAEKILPKKFITIQGEGSIGANGVSEEPVKYSSVGSFEIGGKTFTKQVGFFSKNNNYNLIGSDLTKFFLVTLDFKYKKMYLSPYSDFKEVEAMIHGFDLKIDENGVFVNRLHSNQSAESAGLKLNDRIESINGKKVEVGDFCKFYFSVRRLFQSDEDIELVVQRPDGNKNILIQKKKAIEN